MNIRSVTNNDVEHVSRLVKSLAHCYLNDQNQDLPEWFSSTLSNAAFSDRIGSSEYLNFLYEDDNSIIAYISMKGNNHLYHLFVSEEHQGKGIARKLWEYISNHCAANCYTLRSSLYAVPIYKKFGFIETGSAQEKEGIAFQAMKLEL